MASRAVVLVATMVAMAVVVAFPLAASATTACGPDTPFTMTGAAAVVPIAQKWAKSYQNLCGHSNQITVSTATSSTGAGGNAAAARAVCGVSETPAADIAMLSRPLIAPTEAIQKTKNAYLYTCAKGQTTRLLTQVQVAIDGIAMVAALNSTASNCIASLPGGGLSFSQIRWIFSSLTLAKLKTDPLFDATDIPNSDGKDTTHLWSELCASGARCNCPATEIPIAGSPTSSGFYNFFTKRFFTIKGETFRGAYQSDPYDSSAFVVNFVTASGSGAPALGYTSFVNYNNNYNLIYAASVKDPIEGVFRFIPTFAQFALREYPVAFYLYMHVSNAILPVVQAFFAYAFSDLGNADVTSTGLLPLTHIKAVQMLSRLGAAGGVSLSGIACGPPGTIVMGGSSTVYPVASLWGNVYSDACGVTVTTLAGGSTFGAQLACGVPATNSHELADIGNMSRRFLSKEATHFYGTAYDYKCVIGARRAVREFPVAIDGVTFAFPLNGAAAKCIQTLPNKGLTLDQLRWIYSSYTYAQLVANGWDKSALPNSDGNEATHYWSELGGSGCVPVEIFIAGSPTTAGTFQYFVSTVMTGNGETIAMNRPAGYFNILSDDPDKVVTYLQQVSPAIGYFGYSYYAKNTKTLGAASIKNKAGIFVSPTSATLLDGSYNPFTRFVYMQLSTVFLTFQKTLAFVKFCTSTAVGDTLATAAGLLPLSTATKNLIKPRFSQICFAGTNTVQVWDKGVIEMKDLTIGDRVLNSHGTFDTVYSFGHYAPAIQAEFLQIQARGLRKPLEISKEHMVLVNGAFLPASAVIVGDQMQLPNGHTVHVERISPVLRYGVYAPFTMSGTIVVSDVIASSYVDLQNTAGVLILGGVKTPFTMQFLAHMFQAPHRLTCILSPAYCRAETYDENGISVWVAGPLAFSERLLRLENGILMSCIVATCFLVGVVVYAVEWIVMNVALLFVILAYSSFGRKFDNCETKKP